MRKQRIIGIIAALMILASSILAPASAEGFITDRLEGVGGPHCKSILMMNVDTGTIVYALNPNEPMSIASLTKIMTYIVAYENILDIQNTLITVPEEVITELADTGSSVAGIVAGETYTGIQLLNLMMVPSGNDAALALEKYINSLGITLGDVKEKETARGYEPEIPDAASAENGNQPVDEFANESDDKVMTCIDLMNRKATELGCVATHFMNSHGLYDPQHYSTARDLMKITSFASTLPQFTDIVNQTVYELPPTNMNPETRYSYTTNRMLIDNAGEFYRYATGIKTGTLVESGRCLASSAVYQGYTYIIIALGGFPLQDENGIEFHGEMIDSRELYRWAFTELDMKTIVTTGELLGNVNLKYAWKQDKLQVVAAENVTAILPINVEISSVLTKMDLPDAVEAPIRKGDIIGQAVLTYTDEVIATVPLMAAESVEKSEIMMTLDQGQEVFTSQWFLLIVGVIAVLIVVYIILIVIYRNKKKRYRSVRRHRNM